MNRTIGGATCLAGLAWIALASPAGAKAALGMATFQPNPTLVSQSCVSEYYGSAVNTCSSALSDMLFNLVSDGTAGGTKAVSACNRPINGGIFSCQIESFYSTSELGFLTGGYLSFNGPGCQTNTISGTLQGDVLRLHCRNVPVNSGIHWIGWPNN